MTSRTQVIILLQMYFRKATFLQIIVCSSPWVSTFRIGNSIPNFL